MDVVTGAHLTVGLTVPIAREHMWDLITAVERIGAWSPETVDAQWCDDAAGPVEGARFVGRNKFPNGFEATATCVVVEAAAPSTFTWHVLDDDGLAGSVWRYDLRDGDEPGSTVVQHSFTHGPGATGVRVDAEADPRALHDRLVTLCRNMTTTIVAMAADSTQGALR